MKEAVIDYTASVTLFTEQRDIARASDAKANLALALYSLGEEKEAIKNMKDVIRKNRYGDMHVAIAADSWSKGNYIEAPIRGSLHVIALALAAMPTRTRTGWYV